MSAIQMIIANIQSLNDTDRAQVLGHFAKGAPVPAEPKAGPAKEIEAKKQNANKGRATCYADFAKKIIDEQKEAIAAFKLANPELKGAHLSFVGAYKKDHAEEFSAFEAAWKEAHPKVAVEPSVASDSEPLAEAGEVIMPNEKPKRVMSDEQKAKMKARREAAAAKKLVAVSMAAELMGHGEVPVPAEKKPLTEEAKAMAAVKRAAAKAAKRPTVDTDSGSEISVASAARSASPKLKDE